jgi:hypothetical protein
MESPLPNHQPFFAHDWHSWPPLVPHLLPSLRLPPLALPFIHGLGLMPPCAISTHLAKDHPGCHVEDVVWETTAKVQAKNIAMVLTKVHPVREVFLATLSNNPSPTSHLLTFPTPPALICPSWLHVSP